MPLSEDTGPGPIRITDPDDPRIAPYRDIRERDLAGRDGRFIAEGKVVLNLLARSRFATESVLVLENRLPGLRDTLSAFPSTVPVFVTDREVMDRIAGFPVHRGVLAIGTRRDENDATNLLAACRAPATAVAVVGVSNHDNIGAIFRNAAAFNAAAVVLDDTCCDPLYRKSIRVSVGAALTVPFARAGGHADLIATLCDAGFEPLALSPTAERRLTDIRHPGRLALMLGSEGEGLPADVLQRVKVARIDMVRDLDSLNVATAGAIALHHFFNQLNGEVDFTR